MDDRQGRPSGSTSRAGGVLAGCTVLVSRKTEVCTYPCRPESGNSRDRSQCDRVKLSDNVKAAGGEVVQSFSTSVTHLVYASQKINETFAEFKNARKSNVEIVHPRWVDEVRSCSSFCSLDAADSSYRAQSISSGIHQNEGDFPHTYDPKKGAQLSGLIVSPSRAHPPRLSSASPAKTDRSVSRQSSRSQVTEEDPAFFGGPSTSEFFDVDLPDVNSMDVFPTKDLESLQIDQVAALAAVVSSSPGEANESFTQLPDSRQPSNAQAAGNAGDASEEFNDDAGGMGSSILPRGSPAAVVTSSPSSIVPEAALDTSSDPVDAPAPQPLPAPLPTPHVLLRQQTSVLNGLLQAEPIESVSARMTRRGMARKRVRLPFSVRRATLTCTSLLHRARSKLWTAARLLTDPPSSLPPPTSPAASQAWASSRLSSRSTRRTALTSCTRIQRRLKRGRRFSRRWEGA